MTTSPLTPGPTASFPSFSGARPAAKHFPGISSTSTRVSWSARPISGRSTAGFSTSLPIVETEAQDISGYIPTNLISITDGQLYLSPRLYQKGILPAVDVGKSVSRVGGKAQLPAYRAVAGDVRISHSQLRSWRPSPALEPVSTRQPEKSWKEAWRLREILKQLQYKPIPVAEQIAAILAVTSGQFDPVAVEDIRAAEESLRKKVVDNHGGFCARIAAGEKFGAAERETFVCVAQETAVCFQKEPERADR